MQPPGGIGPKRALPGQGVAEAVQVIQIAVRRHQSAQRPQQGRDEQTGDPPVQHAVADAGVVALGEHITRRGMRHRIDQPGQQAGIVIDDVAVVGRDDLAPARRLHHAQAQPEIAALAPPHRRQPETAQTLHQALHARPVVPDDLMRLRQPAEVG